MSTSTTTTTSITAGTISLGFILTLVAGLFNGSWNASFSSKLGIAISSTNRISKIQHLFTKMHNAYQKLICCSNNSNTDNTNNSYDLNFEYGWILFQIYACLLNLIICIIWLGGINNVINILSKSSSIDIILVIIFSFLWGIGSVSFGLACRIAGVGLGTNLTMGVIVIVGTFLPLITNNLIKTYTGLIIIIGIIVCCVGLYYSMKSLKIRDFDEKQENVKKHTVIVTDEKEDNDALSSSPDNDNDNSDDVESKNTYDNNNSNSDSDNAQKHNYERASGHITSRHIPDTTNITTTSKNQLSSTTENSSSSSPSPIIITYSTTKKVMLCIMAGILSSLLQFAFVFGQPISNIASEMIPNLDKTGGSASIIWLLALLFGIPPSLVYGIYTARKSTEANMPFYKAIVKCPWYRHVLLLISTSIPWVSHIHLYGIAVTIYLPPNIATSIAWPVLMMITVITGMLLSIYLGEWYYASRRAMLYLCVGLGFSFFGIVILMLSILVP